MDVTVKHFIRLLPFAARAACALPGTALTGLTGVLIGTVKDAQAAVIAGAGVRVESAALIGDGRPRRTEEPAALHRAAIGDYTVTVRSPDSGRIACGRHPHRCGRDAGAQHRARLAGVAESVVVRARIAD
jgi:hypothetical protein